MLTVEQYMSAWERKGSQAPRLNTRIVPGACVLETLSMVVDPGMRYAFMDDFGFAVSYCHRRLKDDLIPPDELAGDGVTALWWRMRSAFTRAELAAYWVASDKALWDIVRSFVLDGYSLPLGSRLRKVVNSYALDLELGEIYVLPQDQPALFAQIGSPLTWWNERVKRPEQAEQPFDFADTRHRAILARRLREASKRQA